MFERFVQVDSEETAPTTRSAVLVACPVHVILLGSFVVHGWCFDENGMCLTRVFGHNEGNVSGLS